jgi:hypothetical protein
MFTGWCFSILAGLGLWKSITQYQISRKLNPSTILSFSVVITLLIMDVSGTTQGESGRIWLFLSPFLLLMASDYLVKISANKAQPKIAVTICQGMLILIMISFLPVIRSGLSKPPPIPQSTILAASEMVPSGVTFGDILELESFSGHVEIQENEVTLQLWLNWVSNGQLEIPYYLSFIPVKPSGGTLKAILQQPFNNTKYGKKHSDYPA